MSRTSSSARRALTIHAISTVVATIIVAAISAALTTTMALDAARKQAAAIADTVAHSVAAHLAVIDVSNPDPETHEVVLGELNTFVDAGVIHRAKIWQVEGDEAVVVISDEPRVEGDRRPFSPELAARLDAGEVVVLDVPDDPEHRYEFGRGDLVEAFIGFTDASGVPMRLELYLPSAAPQTLRSVLRAGLSPALLGPILLGVVTFPLALRLARRLEQRDAERRELLQAALAASDRERQRLAARLHDGIIQDLASVGLALASLGKGAVGRGSADPAMLTRVGELLDADIAELRALLTELAPPELEGSLETALRDLATDLQSPRVQIHVAATDGDHTSQETATLTYRIARELIRNAVEHANPGAVFVVLECADEQVRLQVRDDGHGFDTTAPAPEGHLGLSLLRQAVADSGGTFEIESSDAGTTAVVILPDPLARDA